MEGENSVDTDHKFFAISFYISIDEGFFKEKNG